MEGQRHPGQKFTNDGPFIFVGVARRRLGSTGFNIFSSELNVNGYLFKRSNSLLDKGQLIKGKNLLYRLIFYFYFLKRRFIV